MPGNLASLDASFPNLSGKESVEKKLQAVEGYLYLLLESLRYTLANLGQENFNGAALDELAETINHPVLLRLRDTEGNVTGLELSLDGIRTRVSGAEGDISTLEQTATGLGSRVTAAQSTANSAASAASNAQSTANGAASAAAAAQSTANTARSEIVQTANEIRTEVSAAETRAKGYTDDCLTDYSTTTQMNSVISQTAGEIRTEVTAVETTADGAASAAAAAQSTANGAASAASNAQSTADGAASAASNAQSTADGAASAAAAAQSTANGARSEIVQTAGKIALVVETVGGQDVIKAASVVAAINGAGSSVKVAANHIELDGNVVMKSDLTDGTTQISGSNIKTGTISADRIDADALKVQSIWCREPGREDWRVLHAAWESDSAVLTALSHRATIRGNHEARLTTFANNSRIFIGNESENAAGGGSSGITLGAIGDRLSFFGGYPAAQRSVAQINPYSASLTDVANTLYQLIAALKAYNLV